MSLAVENNIVMSCFPRHENAHAKVTQGHLSTYRFKHEETPFFSISKDQRGSGHFAGSRGMQINKDVRHVCTDTFCFL